MTFGQYMGVIKDATVTTLKGMAITWRTFVKVNRRGPVTIQYPEVREIIPDGSRGLLFNDVEDCISCRQCSAACPVDCIYIEAEKKAPADPAEFTKGGIKKTLNLRRFEIDVSLCCYCGLCAAACPTDCLYHTKDYEYSTYDRNNHIIDYLNYRK